MVGKQISITRLGSFERSSNQYVTSGQSKIPIISLVFLKTNFAPTEFILGEWQIFFHGGNNRAKKIQKEWPH